MPQRHDLSHQLLNSLVLLLEGKAVHILDVEQGLDPSVLVLQGAALDLSRVSSQDDLNVLAYQLAICLWRRDTGA